MHAGAEHDLLQVVLRRRRLNLRMNPCIPQHDSGNAEDECHRLRARFPAGQAVLLKRMSQRPAEAVWAGATLKP